MEETDKQINLGCWLKSHVHIRPFNCWFCRITECNNPETKSICEEKRQFCHWWLLMAGFFALVFVLSAYYLLEGAS